VLYPMAFAAVVLLLPLLALAVVLAIGPGRIGQWYLQRATLIEHQYPAEAARMRARLDRVACLWDRVLDWAPAQLAERLALPHVGASRA
ncbi:MAG: hypothetical protein AAGL89_15540, partial [Pseudomonadota bacterium]